MLFYLSLEINKIVLLSISLYFSNLIQFIDLKFNLHGRIFEFNHKRMGC